MVRLASWLNLAATALVALAACSAGSATPPTPSSAVGSSPASTLPRPAVALPVTSATSPSAPAASQHGPTGVDVEDLTFYSLDAGWALATAQCPTSPNRWCTVLLHTTDGVHWTRRFGAPFAVSNPSGRCTGHCVTNIRFADQAVGYAYGPSAFYLTTDGGAHWTRQPGGALALETLNGNVIRVVGTPNGCPGPCNLMVETAGIGRDLWTHRDLGRPTGAPAEQVELARSGADAYVLVVGDVEHASSLYRSTDNGMSWQSSGEPCGEPKKYAQFYSASVVAAPDGRVSVACKIRQVGFGGTIATSVDQGAHFSSLPRFLDDVDEQLPFYDALLAGDPATVLIGAADDVARTTNGGRSWTTITQITGTPTFLGFESPTVARVITDSQKPWTTVLWTTRDGGITWTESSFT